MHAWALANLGPFERLLPSTSSGSEVARVSLAAAARSPGSCAGALHARRGRCIRFLWRRRPAVPGDEGLARGHDGEAAAGHLLHVPMDCMSPPSVGRSITVGYPAPRGIGRECGGHGARNRPATMIARPAHRFPLTVDDVPERSSSKSAALKGALPPRCRASLRADPVWDLCARIDRAGSS